jgi:hypothetical protein
MMDPLSFLLGFSRALVPPLAPPVTQADAPKHAATDLGLDRNLMKALYGDVRIQAPTKAEVAAGLHPGTGAPSPQAPGGPEDAGAAVDPTTRPPTADPATHAAQTEPSKDAQRVQQLREAPPANPIDRVDAADQVGADPLMVAVMKNLYADRLTLSAPAYRHAIEAMAAADLPSPWGAGPR